jgi:hypothetical protein
MVGSKMSPTIQRWAEALPVGPLDVKIFSRQKCNVKHLLGFPGGSPMDWVMISSMDS